MYLGVPYWQEYEIDCYYKRMFILQGLKQNIGALLMWNAVM